MYIFIILLSSSSVSRMSREGRKVGGADWVGEGRGFKSPEMFLGLKKRMSFRGSVNGMWMAGGAEMEQV